MNSVAEQTRAVYHEQHKRMANDDRAMERWTNMFSTRYLCRPDNYFERNSPVLDVGCGDTVKLPIALYKMGARDIHAFDLGEEYMPTARKMLDKFGIPQSAVTLKAASILNIPYPDNYFRFVSCHGVLPHLKDMQEVYRAFSELARVTADGGSLYVVFGAVGGAFEGDGENSGALTGLRKHYRNDAAFKKFVDNIKPEDFAAMIEIITHGLKYHEGFELPPQWKDWLQDKFDTELCVMIQNVLQAPVRLPISEEQILELFKTNDFLNPQPLRRYVKRKNIRQFMAPLHYEKHSPISKIIYGSGNQEFIAMKNFAREYAEAIREDRSE